MVSLRLTYRSAANRVCRARPTSPPDRYALCYQHISIWRIIQNTYLDHRSAARYGAQSRFVVLQRNQLRLLQLAQLAQHLNDSIRFDSMIMNKTKHVRYRSVCLRSDVVVCVLAALCDTTQCRLRTCPTKYAVSLLKKNKNSIIRPNLFIQPIDIATRLTSCQSSTLLFYFFVNEKSKRCFFA